MKRSEATLFMAQIRRQETFGLYHSHGFRGMTETYGYYVSHGYAPLFFLDQETGLWFETNELTFPELISWLRPVEHITAVNPAYLIGFRLYGYTRVMAKRLAGGSIKI